MMTAPKPSYSCACFYTDNIFIQEFHVHVRYTGEQQFRRDYERVLSSQGCRTSEQFRNVLETESFLAAEFLTAVKYSKSPQANVEGLLHHLHSITDKRIYRLPVFIPEFCAKLVEELENFERSDLPKGRPNTMNNYGILLNELGFVDALTAPLCEKYIEPLTSLLFPDWGGGCLDSHRAFVVKYALQEDLDLSCHYDNAEVTLNVSLGKEFTDGNLYFSDMKEVPVNERTYAEVEHITGQGILHRGQHVHGALPISSGERWNLILWMRASDVRNKCCPMCDNEPVLVKTLGDGDGFTSVREDREQTVDICTLT
ncbi:2-oxoglutarate and iron-dependent oxygenase domain-containing protein 2 isoform X3 [Xenopus tropicalis]|uniref:2-oxoglutarate and iron-dependent oxygenase domain-containing protein 2 isoform X3 n=1 Tax=Xenopus tropicalis TaxID=8364 RepID=A0A8J0SQJ4_XENTR|nr:2-oxoglutarate and iron-dependent oxygenase domain-containing protein 2 isoform X3 [Xenopus tropicalis]|eukprot:XP_012819964.1 PREDICTED: 2-oxoglutarate and iron-dependent oxygenase domain-containing protein 2 isoform X3 [Xenopus tropicalis]